MSNKVKIIFLGTSGSIPTNNRNLCSVLIKYNGNNFLFDCAENVQQQIIKSKESIIKIKCIFITHMHGDHYFGLFGLLSSMNLYNRSEKLNIFIPVGYKSKLEKLFKTLKNLKTDFNFEIHISEVKSNFKYEFENIIINSVKLEHSILTYGYVFKIKDKIGKFNKSKALELGIPIGPLFTKLQNGNNIKLNNKIIKPSQVIDYKFKKIGCSIAYLLDGKYILKNNKTLKNIDVLIHDSTFIKEHKDKAKLVKHPCVNEVASFAKKYNVGKLYLTHISSRYKTTEKHLKESRKIFTASFVPNDLDVVELKDYK
jgi:ribonuclease Z